jgi:23S rRNA (guanosine2251-2'-O)-methyltransferase
MEKKEEAFLIYGTHACLEAMRNNADKVERVYVKETLANDAIKEIKALATKHKVPVLFVQGNKLEGMVGDVVHQGLVLMMRSFVYEDLDNFLKNRDQNKNMLFVLMDEIEDPHNVGAIIRSAVAAGADAIIVPKHRNAPINGTVYKTSAGLVDKIPIIRTSNINTAIEKLKKNHIWIAGLAGESTTNMWDQDLTGSIGIVVGNEGEGIHVKTREHCDYLLRIPMSEKAESLNASVSAALLMYEWKRQNI